MNPAPNSHHADEPAHEWATRALDRLWRYFRRCGCQRELAEELAQDACLAALRKGIADLPWEDASPWLHATARNLLRAHFRATQRRRRLAAVMASWPTDDESDERATSLRAALRVCLLRLPARARRALDLRYRERATRGAIARELDITVAGVKTMLRRSRELLRGCIERTNDD